MHNIWTIFHFQLKNSIVNPFRLSWREKHGQFKTIVQPLILLIALLPAFIIYIGGTFVATLYLSGIGKGDMPLQISLILSQIIVLLFSVYPLASAFYFSHDMELMLTLPIKAEEVFIAKFLRVFLEENLLNFLIVFPPFLAYGIYMPVNFFYWIKGIVVILLNPILPLGLALLLMVILMRLMGRSRSKTIFQSLNFIVAIAFGIGIHFMFIHSPMNGEFEQNPMAMLLINQQALLAKASDLFIIARLGKEAMLNLGMTSVLSFLGIFAMVGLVLFVLSYFSRVTYYQTLADNRDTAKRKKKLSKNTFGVHHPVIAIMWKDIKRTLRTPVFLYQSASGMIFFVIFLGMRIVFKGNDHGISFMLDSEIVGFLEKNIWQIRILSGAVLGLALGFFNSFGLTLFSREGKYFWIHRVLPIRPEDEVTGRILYGIMMNLPVIILTVIAYQFFVQVDMYLILFAIPGAVIMLFPQIALPLAVDAKFPNLNWENPAKMQAGNFKFSLAAIGNFILAMLIGYLLIYFTLMEQYWMAMIFVYVGAITLGIIYFFLAIKGVKNPVY